MRDLITIGELAKLMDVSIHQLRYFEEKGILSPKRVEQNGYRLYGFNEIYRLAHILVLRKFDISVADIDKCFKNYKEEDYINLLNSKVTDLNEQIKELTTLRDFTMDLVDKLNNMRNSKEDYIIREMEERNIQQVYDINYEDTTTVKEFYDHFKEFTSLYQTDMITLYDDNRAYICMEVDKNSPETSYKLKDGKYLCYSFLADKDEVFIQVARDFLKYAYNNGFNLTGKLIVQDNTMLSICYNHHIYYEIQALINEN
ncbi:helix-turn-helix domain-containing protein [Vallitalea okinawensis]|uniref:helix-turn-helix domain-containing protein n=1 Tax=Vallitalea okinawensis TaxID=2078660 RepID=UPI000CFDDD65|nr:MerR family transcriptional regulator [Vallitalea okinawensis]